MQCLLELENIAKNIWQEVLCIESSNILMESDFFQLGGDSILAIRVIGIVEKYLNLNLTISDFLNSNSFAEFVDILFRLQQGNYVVSQNSLEMFQADDLNYELPDIDHLPLSNYQNPKHILLTGVTGFVGMQILDELLRTTNATIHCLIRSESQEIATNRADGILTKLNLTAYSNRISVYESDLAESYLGLTTDMFEHLSNAIDSIYHIGAYVNHVYDYNHLRKANVDGTRYLIQLATQHRQKAFYYISTINVIASAENTADLQESWPLGQPQTSEAYTLTKWASEALLKTIAPKFKMPLQIFRLGNITGHSKTGFSDFSRNHLYSLLKGCIELGAAPDWNLPIEMTPVDAIANMIVGLSLHAESKIAIYNLQNPNTIDFASYIHLFTKNQYQVKLINPKTWQFLLTEISQDNPFYSFISLYQDLNEPPLVKNIAQENTLVNLKKLDITHPANYEKLIDGYRIFLNKEAFL